MKEIEQLNSFVNEYYKLNLNDGDRLNYLLQKITGLLYYLETVRSTKHDEFQSAIYVKVKDKMTVARAENESHVEHPEMYLLRRVMDAGYRIVDAIRTNISYLKSEKQNAK